MINRNAAPRHAAVLAAIVMGIQDLSSCTSNESPVVDLLLLNDSTSVVDISEEETVCGVCIHLKRLVTLGDSSGEGYVVATTYIVQDSLGRYWLNQRDRLKVFAGNGAYVGEVGRTGQGPMEFAQPIPQLTDAQGNVIVFDQHNSRETVIDPDFKGVNSTSFHLASTAMTTTALPGSHEYVMNGLIASRDGLARPLHVIDSDTILASFGSGTTKFGREAGFQSVRVLATDAFGHIFTAKHFDYEIRVWSKAGRKIVTIKGAQLNAHQVKSVPYNFDDNPLPNRIVAMHVDNSERLWVLSLRPKSGWRDMFEPQTFPDGSPGLRSKKNPDSFPVEAYGSRLDVIDLHRGRLVARLDAPGMISGFVGDGIVFENLSLPDGTPQIAIWKVDLDSLVES